MAPLLLTKLFAKLSNGKDSVNASELAGFLVSSQGESHGHDDSLYANEEELASSLIIGFHRSRGHSDAPNAAGSSLDSLSFTEFLQFLLDPELNPLMKPSEKPTHDMSRPMSDYFIYTSHNSYLTGNQLTSKSGTSMIKKALLDGCRVIELDCWDDHGVIKVFHGHTLTKPVSFEECLIAIKENAFVTSDYPVIITIEDHMGPDLQNEAAIKMRDIFGENLFVPSSNEKPPIQFASPELLKHKIIISDTPPKDAWHAQAVVDPNTVVDTFPFFIPSQLGPEEDSPPTSPTKFAKVELSLASHIVSAADTILKTTPSPSNAHSRVQDLEDLIYIYSKKIDEMEQSPDGQLVAGDRSIMANLSEPQVKKMALENASSMIKFSYNNLGRMYPFGLRFDSSNPDPFLAWAHGFQLAALNFQGQDRQLWIAQALFQQNGRCGYVRKPQYLLPGNDSNMVNMDPKLLLTVKVLMGNNWKVKDGFAGNPDLYVKVAIDGVALDKARKSTAVIHNNKDPSWENEQFEFQIRVPEMAILRLEAWESDSSSKDDFVGQACFPVCEMKIGLRALTLKSRSGEPLPSTLLCSIHKQEPQKAL